MENEFFKHVLYLILYIAAKLVSTLREFTSQPRGVSVVFAWLSDQEVIISLNIINTPMSVMEIRILMHLRADI